MDRMRTPLLTSLILFLSSTAALAANEVAQAKEQPASSAASPAGAPVPAGAPATPVDKITAEPLPSSTPPNTIPPQAVTDPTAATQVSGAGTTRPVIVEPPAQTEPPSITEVGVQRLPGYAYPEEPDQLRGIKHGSLWLTFHGLQWPYMPSFSGDKRFVIGISGWGWIDNAYQKFAPFPVDNPHLEENRIRYWKQQARMLLRVTPTYAIDRHHFIQGQVELVGTGDQSIQRSAVGGADTDDLFLRVGKWRSWDVQMGRFEGWEVFHLGMGLDFNTFERIGAVGPGDPGIAYYGLSDNQFRPPGASGNFAFHYYPLRILRFELLGMAGNISNGPAYGTRPVAILDLGWLKFKAGVEYRKLINQQLSNQTDVTSKGVGGALQFVFAPHVEFGVNAAQGTIEDIDQNGNLRVEGSFTRTSVGGFANFSNGSPRHPLIFGLGSLMTWTEDQNPLSPNPSNKYWLYQGYAAVQYVIQNVFYIKLVAGYSRSHFALAGTEPRVEFDDEMYSARLRFSYYF
jgi:hypothetical protein